MYVCICVYVCLFVCLPSGCRVCGHTDPEIGYSDMKAQTGSGICVIQRLVHNEDLVLCGLVPQWEELCLHRV